MAEYEYSASDLRVLRAVGLEPIGQAAPGTDPLSGLTPEESMSVLAASAGPYGKGKHPVAQSVDELARRIHYRNSPYGVAGRAAMHFGQRKLLLSEVQFLSRNRGLYPKSSVVVYAGAAPSSHTPFLSRLFPDLTFELYDPAKFAIKESSKIRIHQEFFTDEIARFWRGRKTFFVSDIRSARSGVSNQDFEDAVAADMAAQRRWVGMIDPVASLLKFRLPYARGETEYIGGTPLLQAWSPRSSTEIRLEVRDNSSSRLYDNTEFEEKLYYQNTISREWEYFDHGMDCALVPGLDHCYECALEIDIWKEYLSKLTRGRADRAAGRPVEELVAEKMNEASGALKRPLDVFHHGVLPDTPMLAKRVQLLPRIQMYNASILYKK